MSFKLFWSLLTTAAALWLSGVPAVAAEESSSVEDILEVLREQDLIDDSTHTRILTKHHNQEARDTDVSGRLLEGWDFSGDFRLRHESFWFDEDDLGNEATNRHRLRYRARFKVTKAVNDWLGVGFRLVSGSDDERSSNQTLGSGPDFDTDDIRFDQAYAAIAPDLGIEDLDLELVGGKVANPFRWKNGKDYLVWDGDITLEGAHLMLTKTPTDSLELFSTFGYYVDDENSSSSDPKLVGIQAGGHLQASDTLRVGARATGYQWRSLDADFITRAVAFGNLPTAFDDTKARVGELTAYVTCTCFEAWPVTLFGSFARNFDADDGIVGGVTFGEESDAWLAGVEVGDKKRFAKLGFTYGEIEANALIAQLIDSDFTDGFTNRHGWSVYASRQIAERVDVNLELFNSDVLDDGVVPAGDPFDDSAENADRWRLRTDLVVKFD